VESSPHLRRTSTGVKYFLVAPHIIASSDLLLTMAERVANVVPGPLGLVVLSPPPEDHPPRYCRSGHSDYAARDGDIGSQFGFNRTYPTCE
jgi:hypothetical protein